MRAWLSIDTIDPLVYPWIHHSSDTYICARWRPQPNPPQDNSCGWRQTVAYAAGWHMPYRKAKCTMHNAQRLEATDATAPSAASATLKRPTHLRLLPESDFGDNSEANMLHPSGWMIHPPLHVDSLRTPASGHPQMSTRPLLGSHCTNDRKKVTARVLRSETTCEMLQSNDWVV